MGEIKCDHCGGKTRVRTFMLHWKEMNICRHCALDVLYLQKELQQWVG